MKNSFQGGGPQLASNDFQLEFDAEISYAGRWWSLNDHFNYRVTTEGMGITEQTFRRKTITSDFFEGEYTTHSVRANTKRTAEIWVYGDSQSVVSENVQRAIDWFTQDSYNLRVRLNEDVEILLCGGADYRVDRSHLMAHNKMAKITFTYDAHPDVSREVWL